MSTELPAIGGQLPCYRELRAGESLQWCSCGLSATQPLCDGSHRASALRPLRYVAPCDEEVLLCTCKRTRTPPFCDGAHNNLPGAKPLDDPDSPANRAIPVVGVDDRGRAWLDGGCYVCSVDALPRERLGALAIASVIDAPSGAQHQSLFLLELGAGECSPVLAFPAHEIALLVTGGRGQATISGRRFPIAADSGLCVRPGEALALEASAGEGLRIFASVGPLASAPVVLGEMPEDFQSDWPSRHVPVDGAARQAMGERFFQMLVDRNAGSRMLTQFIGEIPLSKAMPHRHLYEESLVVLRGSGWMWTETCKAAVGAGDVIFLPRRQLHSLQCTDPAGMFVAGVIYPGDNPAINY
jgi:CDGSH-type Zn-finger protein/quercetin dioxygenase-like cupin family protein